MTDGYNGFAGFYDGLMEDAQYDLRARQLLDICGVHSHTPGRTLDLACGTGRLTRELKKLGVDVFGCDGSPDMLTEAMRNNGDDPILYICQDMRELDLGAEIDTCVCTLDSVNHLVSEDDVLAAFCGVAEYLRQGGLFIFDVNTVYKHREILGDNAFVLENEEVFCAWQNTLEEDDTVLIDLDFFVPNGDLYERFSESFRERAYSDEKLRELLLAAGLTVEGVYGELTLEPPKPDGQRAVYAARKI